MSVKSKGTKNNQQTTLVTTGRGAALTVTFGITLTVLGIAWFISQLAFAQDSYVLNELSRALQGLGGPLCVFLPVLLCWGGVKMMVSARHRVSGRDFWLVFAIYLLVLAGYTLIARVQQNGAAVTFMDFVGRQNYKVRELGFDSLTAYLQQAYSLRISGAGGLLGMLIAYPIWRVLGNFLATVLVAVALIVLLFLLLRINPTNLFRSASEKSERRQMEKARKKQEQKAASAQAQQISDDTENMAPTETQSADWQNTVSAPADNTAYPAAANYYQPAPVYENIYQPQPVQARGNKDFYPVGHDLYDEYVPQRDIKKDHLWSDDNSQDGAYDPIETAPANTPQPAWEAPVQQPRAENKSKSASDGAENPYLSPMPVKQNETAVPIYSRTEETLSWEEPEKPYDEPGSSGSQTHEEPVRQDDPIKETKKTGFVPFGKQNEAKPTVTAEKPAAKKPEQKPVKSDWASQVRRKEAEINDELPEHTTARGEPKPVYTDPVMPITRERISISPRSDDRHEDAHLDGTLSPKPQQGKMGLSIPYQAPPIRLLNEARHIPQEDAAQEDEKRAQIIEGTLGSFGVEAEVKQIMHGPSITRFAIQIAPGVKVSRVTNTADNLALDLKTQHVRVEAPIQGTSYIGIEVPNKLVSTVSLREVLDSPEMRNNPSPLLVALGKDIAGAPILCDLSKMPHLLIAGATGSGKSVCINSIVCSLLYRTSPDQVRLIMVDPKQVELSVYNSIPHLLIPVVSDPRKASGALAWVVQEMLERYGKFSAQNVRNLAGYNKVNQGTDKVLPNIVVIIDEMADLMEVCRKDVEESIRRLAALARAAGIYMVLATQRPSVDVITGVIKNNIPSRIAFAVSSGTDSRTIIDINGAEKLMGKGDMLYKPAGASPLRVQGCLVTDDEVNAITDYIASRYETDYDPNIIEHLENADKEKLDADEITAEDDVGENDGSVDDLLVEAIEMAVEDGQTSTSMLQRRLRVGYARAGRLVDEMEKRGVVSHSEGSKPRKTLITREQYYEMFRDS